jgi:hypothetical protein
MEDSVIKYMKNVAKNCKSNQALHNLDYHLQTHFTPLYGEDWGSSIWKLGLRSHQASKLHIANEMLRNTDFEDFDNTKKTHDFIYGDVMPSVFNATKNNGSYAFMIFGDIDYKFQLKSKFDSLSLEQGTFESAKNI